MTRDAIKEVKAECRRWWGRLMWGREAMRRNMETFRRCGKMTAEIEADNAKAEVERATQMRLAAAARVGIAALETRAEKSSSLRRVGSLCARWRAEANTMEKLADECDDLDEEKDAAECRERARTFRECANDLERKWAGTEATEVLAFVSRTRLCSCGSGKPSHREYDAQGIYLCAVCPACKAEKLGRYRSCILTGYDQSDVDEPIEPEDA